MLKKFVSALLCLCIIISVASCSEKESDNQQETASVTETQAETTDYLETLPKENYGGYSFRIIAQHFNERPNFPDETETGDVLNDALYRRNKQVEELLGINFENIAYEDRGQVRTKVMTAVNANEDAYDLCITSMADGINTLAPGGLLADLNAMRHLALDKEWWCASINDMQFNGKLYFTSGALSPFFYYTPTAMAYNMRLAEDLGITGIDKIIVAGEWTADKLLELSKGVTEDIDGNSVLDINDRWALAHDGGVAGQAFVIGFGGSMTGKDENGNHILTMDTEQTVTLVEKASSILGDKSLAFTGTSGSELELFQKGNLLFLVTAMNNVIAGYFGIPSFRQLNDDYGLMPPPKLTETQDKYYCYFNPWGPSGICVPITVPDTDRTSLVMETMAYISHRDVNPVIYDVLLKEKIARDDNSRIMIDLIYASACYELNGIYNFGDSANLLRNCAAGVQKNYVSQYAKIKKAAEKALEKMLEMANNA
jgi:hypothetical protein